VAINLSRFRTRSPERDRAADLQRVEKVRAELMAARASAMAECKGLETRIQSYLLQASMLLDSSEAYGSRTPADEFQISHYEGRAEAGRLRVREIQQQIAMFDQMLIVLESTSQDATTLSASNSRNAR
jgi:hypothetical protein